MVGNVGAGIYKWVDAEGKVHLSDSPPAGQEASGHEAGRALTETAKIATIGESASSGVAVITVSATEIKNRMGRYLSRVAVEPVAVETNGRPVAVLLSWEEYALLQRSDDCFWGQAARAAEAEGFLSADDSLEYLQRGQRSEGRAAS